MKRIYALSPSVFLVAAMIMVLVSSSQAIASLRVVFLPIYTLDGDTIREIGKIAELNRKFLGPMINPVVRGGYEVRQPVWESDSEYSKIIEKANLNPPGACMDICNKTGADVAYITWIELEKEIASDNLCTTYIRVNGQGHDSAGRDLGIHISKYFNISAKNANEAMDNILKEAGHLVGSKLTTRLFRRKDSAGGE